MLRALDDWARGAPSWMASLVVHMLAMIVLGLAPMLVMDDDDIDVFAADVSTEYIEQLDEDLNDLVKPQNELILEQMQAAQLESIAKSVELTVADDMVSSPTKVELGVSVYDSAALTDFMGVGASTGRGLEGRGEQAREDLAEQRGATRASEAAVARALEWLAAHQSPDGSWSFNHVRPECHKQCTHPGALRNARLAATGLVLLPFLGAGNTHLSGKYKTNVQAGLYYLASKMKTGPNGGALNFDQGRMYGHGICSIALAEAFGMTQDPLLEGPAEAALKFISYAQDPTGGGWRYEPRQPGDTSVVGWQLMALKSGHMAYLRVDPTTIKAAYNFLDAVQSDGGAAYGYTGPGGSKATTAIGLLSRIYLGWPREHPALARGVERLGKWGPSKAGDMYFNYYATQVMAQYEGEPWEKWNPVMRDFLVKKQERRRHARGSWDFGSGGDHGSGSGGRLYSTAMATMVLEVYYRHMPIYKTQVGDDAFSN